MKIGKADDTQVRLKTLQRFSPVPLKVLAAAVGGRRLEAKLHRDYRRHRLWGEWFNLPADKLGRLREWMDERPDWRWALLIRGAEMKERVDDMRARVKADKSLQGEEREWVIGSLSDLRSLVAGLRLFSRPYLLPNLDAIKRLAGRIRTKATAEGFLSEGEREWFGDSLEQLRSADGTRPYFQLTGPLSRDDAEALATGYRRWLTEVIDAARA